MGSCWHDQTETQHFCIIATVARMHNLPYPSGTGNVDESPDSDRCLDAQPHAYHGHRRTVENEIVISVQWLSELRSNKLDSISNQMGPNCLEYVHTTSEIFMGSFPRRLRRLVELVTVVRGRQSHSPVNIYMCRLDHFIARAAFYFA